MCELLDKLLSISSSEQGLSELRLVRFDVAITSLEETLVTRLALLCH